MADGDNLVIGQNNAGTSRTLLERTSNNVDAAFQIGNNQGVGISVFAQRGNALSVRTLVGPFSGTFSASEEDNGVLGLSGGSESGVTPPQFRRAGVLGTSVDRAGVLGESTTSVGIRGHSRDLNGVEGQSASPGASGVYGQNNGGGFGVAGRTGGGQPAVLGDNTTPGGPTHVQGGSPGVRGQGSPGVQGFGPAGGFGVGVHGIEVGPGWAGLFEGLTEVRGTLLKSGGGFRIDHPLDAENKYLQHSFVESPEMKNVYDGVVELDKDGTGWVELPEWFGALNRDYRYQLTAIGEPAPELHIAEEISENRFEIAGGKEGMRVCWQVTGVRKDEWAEANRVEVELEKSVDQREQREPETL